MIHDALQIVNIADLVSKTLYISTLYIACSARCYYRIYGVLQSATATIANISERMCAFTWLQKICMSVVLMLLFHFLIDNKMVAGMLARRTEGAFVYSSTPTLNLQYAATGSLNRSTVLVLSIHSHKPSPTADFLILFSAQPF